jgi:hypothetical protein
MSRTIYSPKHNSYRQVWYGENPIPRPPDDVQYKISTYDGPLGLGYELLYERKKNGKDEEKRVNIGPEKHRDHDWKEKAKDNLPI